MGAINTRDATEEWMKSMGTKFVDVFLFTRGGNWLKEAQVADEETFLETVNMAMDRYKASHALWDDGEKWCLLSWDTGDAKRYPSRAAAEMVAIHVGR